MLFGFYYEYIIGVIKLEEQLRLLLEYSIRKEASDIHFILNNNYLKISLRTMNGFEQIVQDLWGPSLFEYIKFISGLDLFHPMDPQSGQFRFRVLEMDYSFRFSIIVNNGIETGVLRILKFNTKFLIDELVLQVEQREYFHRLSQSRQGLIISSGPTNSGKTTTIHSLLHEIAKKNNFKVVTLEDPIEIYDDGYLQLQINNEAGFTYEKGIEELLRHDPDVIFIGETRNEYTAKMLIRAALTGHLVFTTIHAKDGRETINRLLDLGVNSYDLSNTLTSVFAQRLYNKKHGGKQCIYEILDQEEIQTVLSTHRYSESHRSLGEEIQYAINNGYIDDSQAWIDAEDLRR